MTYFKNVTNLEEAKKQYRELAKQYHPDRCGDTEIMKEINNEYEIIIKTTFEKSAKEFTEEKGWNDFNCTPFVSILQKIIHFEMDIEVIGVWIYAFNSYEYKEQLKELGFWFSKKHKAWIFSGMKKRNLRTKYTTNDVRNMHGSHKVESERLTAIA